MSEKVRSQIFHSSAELTKEFQDRLNLVWKLNDIQRQIILDNFLPIIQSKTERDVRIAIQHLVEKVGGLESDATKIINVLQYISSTWNPLRDEVDSVISDFVELGFLPAEEESQKDIIRFLSKFLSQLKNNNESQLNYDTSRQILASLKRIDVCIDLRAVVESDFDWSNDDPNEYQPIIRRTVPVAVLKIAVDYGDDLIMQADRNDLEMMVRRLQAAIKEMDISELIQK